jgi:hypothetical protein
MPGRCGAVGRGGDVDTARRGREHALELSAHPRELGEQCVALPRQVDDLGADVLLLGTGGGVGLVADLRGLFLRRLQDALHTIAEVADDVGRLAILGRGETGPRARGGAWTCPGLAGKTARRRRDDRERVAARHLEISAHPRQHALETGHVLVDLLAIVAPEDDVETWSAERTRITRHPSSLPSAKAPPPCRG